MTIKEIDQEIYRLREMKTRLEYQEREEFRERARQHIGRCFRVNGQYAKVLDVPHERLLRGGGVDFNQYQFPALWIGLDVDSVALGHLPIVPFYEDTLFSAAWGEGQDSLGTRYEEITPEEFAAEFARALDKFKNQIGV